MLSHLEETEGRNRVSIVINEERTWLPGNRTAPIPRKSLSCICSLMRDQSQLFTHTGVGRLDSKQLFRF